MRYGVDFRSFGTIFMRESISKTFVNNRALIAVIYKSLKDKI